MGWGVWCLVSGVKEWCFAHDGRQACKTSGSRPTRQLCPETVAGERRDGSMALGNFLEDRPAEQRKLGIAAGVSLERCREAVPGACSGASVPGHDHCDLHVAMAFLSGVLDSSPLQWPCHIDGHATSNHASSTSITFNYSRLYSCLFSRQSSGRGAKARARDFNFVTPGQSAASPYASCLKVAPVVPDQVGAIILPRCRIIVSSYHQQPVTCAMIH